MLKVRQIQWLLASVFFTLGGWLVVWPSSVMMLTVRPEYQSYHPTTLLAFLCFGLQALISGTLAAFTQFTKSTFLAYGIGLLPFFAFNYWVYIVVPMITELGLLDLVGNVMMLILCWMGWHAVARERVEHKYRPGVRSFQWLLVCVFTVLGTLLLFYPSTVMAWAVRAEHQVYDTAVLFGLGAFGSQMLISALFCGFSRFEKHTAFMFALSTLPFCIFSLWYYFINPVLAPAGMLLILALFFCFGFRTIM